MLVAVQTRHLYMQSNLKHVTLNFPIMYNGDNLVHWLTPCTYHFCDTGALVCHNTLSLENLHLQVS